MKNHPRKLKLSGMVFAVTDSFPPNLAPCRSATNVRYNSFPVSLFISKSSGIVNRTRSRRASNDPDSSTNPGISSLVATHTPASASQSIRIGIVCEGDRDYDLLCALIEELYPKHEFIFRLLQPDGFLNRELGNGWKGVWSWCRENGDRISEIALGIQPGYDLFIVQMDSDVSRNEKEAHCACHAVDCQFREKTNLPKCNYTSTCAIRMPCPNHEQSVAARTEHLCSILSPYFPDEIAVQLFLLFRVIAQMPGLSLRWMSWMNMKRFLILGIM